MTRQGPNRRRAPRVRITNLVGYSSLRDDHIYQHLGTAQTLDLSESGFRLRVREALPIGGELAFELKLAGDLYKLHGRIVWGEELEPDEAYEFGVRFVEVPDKVRESLRVYVSLKQAPSEEGE